MKDLPFLESLNVEDNRLTDEGLCPLVEAVSCIPGLLELNLSQNQIGERASQALFEFLRNPACKLQSLVLNRADVDDFECANFIEAISSCKTLRKIDLSGNLVGGKGNNLF